MLEEALNIYLVLILIVIGGGIFFGAIIIVAKIMFWLTDNL